MSTDKERMEMLLAHLQMNANELAASLGYKRSDRIYHVQKGRNGISERLAREICNKYPELSYTWIKHGTGEMLKATEATDTALGSSGASIGKGLASVMGTGIASAVAAGAACATTGISGLFGALFGGLFSDSEDLTDEEAIEVLKSALEDHKRICAENEDLREEVEYWRDKANNLEYQLTKTKAG